MNKRYPGRPNYTGPKKGYFLLPYHDTLVTRMTNIFERLDTIDRTKSKKQISWRRHCIVYVQPSKLPLKVLAACTVYWRAYIAWTKALINHRASFVAYMTRHKAGLALRKILKTHDKELTVLLTKYVPDHTWNGKEIEFKE
ncbi:hypothetical protein LCGC14_0601770 [marine sediment metagenome]|uniref:Uncharacterized protein n=1 Tax=marine sediment metagenome TaxID=412755 RepID=A0A0F9RAD7_9ZZZZ|nr:hypothetical protein [Pricia sp.]